MAAPDLSLAVLRRQQAARKTIDQNIHNLALAMFKPNLKIQFVSKGHDYYGQVVEVIGGPGNTWLRVRNMTTNKIRDIRLDDVTGLVLE